MKMKGTETFRMAVRTLGSTATAAVAKAGWTLDDLDLVIPHQANIRIIEGLAKALDFPMERVFVNVQCYGNTSAASVPLALSEAVAAGRVKPGHKMLLVAFGAGLTSAAIAFEWTGDPADASRALGIGPEQVGIVPGYLEAVNPFPPDLEWVRAGKSSPSPSSSTSPASPASPASSAVCPASSVADPA